MMQVEVKRKAEGSRIVAEYERRANVIPPERYRATSPSVLFMLQERLRIFIRVLRGEGILPLEDRRILDVGCGSGSWLAEFESLGVRRANMSAIELNPERGKVAQARFGALRDVTGRVLSEGADIRIGDASLLPWEDAAFDLVLQSTVLTSILDDTMRKAVANEMMRVTKPKGLIIWYDFFVDNPWNSAVRGIGVREIRRLFPSREIRLCRVTLAPPIARRLVPISWTAAHLLENLRILNTHYFGIIRNTNSPNKSQRNSREGHDSLSVLSA